ncbi:MAG: TATA-box-binding protein [archaeon]|nr:TATA-box-binding protein [archaeon]
MTVIDIQNIVASSSLCRELDLNLIQKEFQNVKYDPKQFPGLIYRIKEPKTAILLFKSGKIVCTGGKCIGDVETAVAKVASDLNGIGIEVPAKPKVEVQNMVASSDLGHDLNLNTVAITLGLERVEYEPEQFPGLVFRLDDPKVVILLFGSGKLVCAGAKVEEDVERAVDNVAAELRDEGLIP